MSGAHPKIFDALTAATPAVDAARAVLESRLSAVEELVDAVADARSPSVTQVHRLRVATRRADAALRAFRPLLRRKRALRVRKLLRRYRRGAAAARVADVQANLLRRMGPDQVGDGARVVEEVEARLRHRAVVARRDLAEAVAKRPTKRLRRAHRQLLRDLKGSTLRFEELAAESLTPLVRRLDAIGARELVAIDDLHALRLAGKRVRYALEIFSPCLGAPTAEVHERVRAMQDELGIINDQHEIADAVERWAGRHGRETDAAALVGRWRTQRDERAAAFVQAWNGPAVLLNGLRGAVVPPWHAPEPERAKEHQP